MAGLFYCVGEGKHKERFFGLVFCVFIIIGASIQLSVILDFADALIFVMAIPNIIGLYILAPDVKKDLQVYMAKLKAAQAT
jgi:AGCS family alanine or glycine:cation symporter